MAAVLGLLAVAACGSSNGAPAGGGDAAGAPKVRLANFGQYALTLPLAVAVHEDLFAKHGVDVTLNPPIFNGVDQVRSLVNGDADMSFQNMLLAVPAVAQGRDVVAVAQLTKGSPVEIVVNKESLGKLQSNGASPDAPLSSKLAAFKGLTLGTPGTGASSDSTVRFALKEAGVDPERDVTFQTIGDPAALLAALRQGRIDGAITGTGGPVYGLISEGSAVTWVNLGFEDPKISELPLYGLQTSSTFLRDNPDAVKGVIAAFKEALDRITAGLPTDELAEIKKAIAPDLDQGVWDLSIQRLLPLWDTDIAFTKEQFATTLELHNLTATNPANITYEQFVNNSFVG